MRARFLSNGFSYIHQSSSEDYAKVAGPSDTNEDSSGGVEVITDSVKNINLNATVNGSSNNWRIVLNNEKKQEYLKNEVTIKYLLLQGLNDDDQDLFDEYEAPMAL